MDPQADSSTPKPHYEQGVLLDSDEQVVTVIRRHIIGVIAMVFVGLAAIAAIVALLATLLPDAFTSTAHLNSLAVAFAAILVIVLIVLVAIFVYIQSRLLITNKNVVQVLQKTLFNRKVSRLSIANVEDVNAEQRGILATIFNYGTLTVQTAGEMENFIFTLCPNPNKFAEQVQEAREDYAQSLEEEASHPH